MSGHKTFRSTKKRRKTPKIRKKRPPGTAPGETGDLEVKPTKVSVFSYSGEHFTEYKDKVAEDRIKNLDENATNWVDISGTGSYATIKEIGDKFNLHALSIEDVVNANQRSKIEHYDDTTFIVTRMIPSADKTVTRQLSIFVVKNTVITIHAGSKDCLDPVRDRLRGPASQIRKMGANYLVYAIIDAVIDTYFPVLENFADHLDFLEENLMLDTSEEEISIGRIHDVKSELLLLRRIIWGHRELLNEVLRDPPKASGEDLSIYWRDCFDHTLQQLDLVETYRDVCSSLMDLRFSISNTKSNEVMKVLTVIASIFIPLTFIAGLYGMNFNSDKSGYNMPELHWRFGYPAVLILMFLMASGMLVYFKKKKWI